MRLYQLKTIRTALAVLLTTQLATLAAKADANFDRGVKLYAQKDYKNAVLCFDMALQENPKDSNALYYKALSLQQSGNLTGAVSAYTSLTTDFPGTQAAAFATKVLDRVKAMPPAKPAAGSAVAPKSDAGTDYTKFDAANATDDDLAKLPDETRIPFTRGNGGHLFVTGYLNNHPMQLMFDTGASTCLFGKNHFTSAGVVDAVMTGSSTAVGGVGGSQAATAALVDLRVGDITRHMPVMVVKDLPTPPLLGETFYNGFTCNIDNQAGIIHLTKKNAAHKTSYSSYSDVEVPFQQVGNNMVVMAKVNGHDCPMFFDTGAAGVVFSVQNAMSAGLQIPSNAKRVVRGGVGGAAAGLEFDCDRIELGSVAEYHIPVDVMLTGGPPLPLLGQPFFQHRRFTIDNEKHVIKFAR